MMTSLNGNIFRVTGHLCGEHAGHRWIPRTKGPVTRSFDVFFDLPQNKQLSKQSWGLWFETLSRPLWRRCNGENCSRYNGPVLPNMFHSPHVQLCSVLARFHFTYFIQRYLTGTDTIISPLLHSNFGKSQNSMQIITATKTRKQNIFLEVTVWAQIQIMLPTIFSRIIAVIPYAIWFENIFWVNALCDGCWKHATS